VIIDPGTPVSYASPTRLDKNVLFVTINLPDIVESSVQYDLKPTALFFKAQAG